MTQPPHKTDAQAPAAERRRHKRVTVPALATPFGEVVDLSVSGMQVFHKGALSQQPGDQIQITLDHPAGTLHVTAEVVWTDQVGLRRHLLGYRFLDLDPTTSAALESLVDQGQPEAKGPAVYLDR